MDAKKLKDPDPRPHLNVVFIGHVDAGKSTACGQILLLTGQVDERSIEKYEKEAKDNGRESWFLAYIVDCNDEEREKGKTVEVARAQFTLSKTRFTVLDAPGHRSYVPAMIAGAAQADVAVLLVSARKGEFEAGFERGGQTREHAVLAKTLGVSYMVVAINKMDDPTVLWDKDRYDEIEKKISTYLRSCGYSPAQVTFVPTSGFLGQNLEVHATDPKFGQMATHAKWYGPDQPTLFSVLDNLRPIERNPDAPLRIPLLEGFRDGSVYTMGKVESGTATPNSDAVLMPQKVNVKILAVLIGEDPYRYALPGENVTVRVSGCEETEITRGSVLCLRSAPCSVANVIKVQMVVVELFESRPIMTAGYGCVFHAHTASEEATIATLHEAVDKAARTKKIKPKFAKANSVVVCDIELASPLALEPFAVTAQLGRFTLRDEGRTIAIGKILEIVS